MFQRYVAKVDQGYCICCNSCTRMLQASVPELTFHLYFQMYVESVFISIFYMFYTYVASVLSGFCIYLQWFSSVFQVSFASVSEAYFKLFHLSFRRMLQVLHLDISKVDRVLHMLQCHPPVAAARGGRERAQMPCGVGQGANAMLG
jgi:hypothetical protein